MTRLDLNILMLRNQAGIMFGLSSICQDRHLDSMAAALKRGGDETIRAIAEFQSSPKEGHGTDGRPGTEPEA